MSNLQLISDAVDKYADRDKSPFANKFVTPVQFVHTLSGVLGLRKPIVVDNHHREDAAGVQRIASLARPWKPIRQYAFLREGPPGGRYNPVEDPYGLPPAAPGACVHVAGTDSDSVRSAYTCGRMRAPFVGATLPGQKRHQAVVHKSLEGEQIAGALNSVVSGIEKLLSQVPGQAEEVRKTLNTFITHPIITKAAGKSHPTTHLPTPTLNLAKDVKDIKAAIVSRFKKRSSPATSQANPPPTRDYHGLAIPVTGRGYGSRGYGSG
ncbi:hypothetical protein EDB84DRAFT_1674726 [Lactarius hengduanensis]|nr:hypothetical protein EDB84DRAFT_1674726 [Lactarius hengduanensis]